MLEINKYYSLKNKIGEGTYGKVWLAIHNETREKVAIKILNKHKISSEEDIKRIKREIFILKRVKHPNILKLY
jgi:serine/threonine protein kinase